MLYVALSRPIISLSLRRVLGSAMTLFIELSSCFLRLAKVLGLTITNRELRRSILSGGLSPWMIGLSLMWMSLWRVRVMLLIMSWILPDYLELGSWALIYRKLEVRSITAAEISRVILALKYAWSLGEKKVCVESNLINTSYIKDKSTFYYRISLPLNFNISFILHVFFKRSIFFNLIIFNNELSIYFLY